MRFFPVPQEPLRQSTQAPDHHSPRYYGGELLQGNGGRVGDAISDPHQSVPEGLRHAETASCHSMAPGRAETGGWPLIACAWGTAVATPRRDSNCLTFSRAAGRSAFTRAPVTEIGIGKSA